MTELCDEYGISRKTGYKWIDRYLRPAPRACEEHSRRPTAQPQRRPRAIVQALLERAVAIPRGARRSCWHPARRTPPLGVAARSTVCDILRRHGLIPKKPPAARSAIPANPPADRGPQRGVVRGFQRPVQTATACTAIRSRSPTATAAICSVARGCSHRRATTPSRLHAAFQEYGLPRRIRTDNGVPFATNTLARLSRLSAWWVRLGILPELIEPGKPQQNGRHERMHRTLKAETTRPARRTSAQQRASTLPPRVQHERPHEALDSKRRLALQLAARDARKTAAARVSGSLRECATSAPTAASAGTALGQRLHVCIGEYVGLEEIDDGVWNVYFGPLRSAPTAC